MSVDESSFHTAADAMLHRLFDRLDEAIGEVSDVELQGGVLTITLDSGGQYVLNKQAPTRQLWLSSPVSGAWHFLYEAGSWLASKDRSVELAALLAGELGAASGRPVQL